MPTACPVRTCPLTSLVRLLSTFALALALLAVTAGDDPARAQEAAGSIAGTVTDPDGEPLDGICPRATRYGEPPGESARPPQPTEAGSYRFEDLTDGYYAVSFAECDDEGRFEATGLRDETGEPVVVEVADGRAVTGIDQQLQRRQPVSGTITGTITLPEDVQTTQLCIDSQIITDGTFQTNTRHDPIAPGEREVPYEIQITVEDGGVDGIYVAAQPCTDGTVLGIYDGAAGTLDPRQAAPVTLDTSGVDFTLQPGIAITAQAQDPAGTPLSVCWNLTAATEDQRAQFSSFGQSDDGVIVALGYEGEQTLTLNHCPQDGSRTRMLPFTQQLSLPGDAVPPVFVLQPGVRVEGTVTDPNGDPVVFPEVLLTFLTGTFVDFSFGEQPGQFASQPQEPGTYALGISPRYQRFDLLISHQQTVVLPAGDESVELNVTLDRGAGLRTALDPGERCIDFGDELLAPTGPRYFTDILHTGEMLVTGIPAGTYDIDVGCTDPQRLPGLTLRAGTVTDLATLDTEVPPGDDDPADDPADDPGDEPGDEPAEEGPEFTDRFEDVLVGSVHADNILRLVDAGITEGCGPSIFCPTNPVTRAQMATFLTRALDLPIPDERIEFSDVDDDNTHADNIQALAAEGITLGCGDGIFCPSEPVTREQMATFLVRALDL